MHEKWRYEAVVEEYGRYAGRVYRYIKTSDGVCLAEVFPDKTSAQSMWNGQVMAAGLEMLRMLQWAEEWISREMIQARDPDTGAAYNHDTMRLENMRDLIERLDFLTANAYDDDYRC